ncbi:MAG TPA: nucleotidyl transferase AbiEii/AbiGii toxin family protein [Saprospiraceae bacterium]|nr:nucleotidyl transferase AbiEii/AbiGii toxin family protein [Saprospiraceae bacterium]
MGLPAVAAVEKDWWVVRTLQLVFETEIAEHTVFKGGTSLSKAWSLIDRFSEDIDLALDRKFLGFDKPDIEMNGSQVSKLRRESNSYITATYLPQIEKDFAKAGFTEVKLQLVAIKAPDEDPVKILVHYPSVTAPSRYLPPKVEIEIGCRSLIEPYTEREIVSFVGERFKGRPFADTEIIIPVVNPERTFLEKVFLLHEEFQQPTEKIRTERKSRHLYDLEKMMDTMFGLKALSDKELYQHIVEHRKTITPIRGIGYANHSPATINIIPPADVLDAWKKDYEEMQESMIYKESLPFERLMDRIQELQNKINQLKWQSTST